jgi:acyl-CoA thioester hydrolase
MSSAPPFEMTLHTRWGDLDSNGHMANAAYLDACVDVRFAYFASRGFPLARFAELAVGPVIFKDEIEYFRELRLLDPMRITLAIAGASEDGSHFRLVNEYFRARPGDERLAARLVTTGSWLDLKTRKLTRPPEELAATLRAMPRTADFAPLPSMVRS